MDKQQTPFRVGGVYRDAEGDVIRLIVDEGEVVADYLREDGWAVHGGTFNLATGECRGYPFANLLPGELHCVNGEWVPISAAHASDCALPVGPCDCGAAPEPLRPPLDWNARKPFGPFGPEFLVTKGCGEAIPVPAPPAPSGKAMPHWSSRSSTEAAPAGGLSKRWGRG